MDIPNKMNKKLSFDTVVHHRINKLLGSIDRFKGSWEVLEQTKRGYLKELRKVATIESIGSSTRIEGVTLSDKEVEQLLRSVKVSKLEKRDEQEVVGYYEALELILVHHQEIPFNQSYIHQLHSLLLKYSSKDQKHKGRFKITSNKVVANYPGGAQRVIFRTTEPHLTSSEMEGLLQWLDERNKQDDLHPLIVVSAFVYEFLSIHPYQDGNGRLSRLLTTLLLLQNDYHFVEYVSFEHVIESSKQRYYKALIDGQKDRYSDKECIDSWVLYFLERMVELCERLRVKYDTFNKLKLSLNERQQEIMTFIKEQEVVQLKDVDEAFEFYSRNTLKKDMSYLYNEGLIGKMGAGRGVKYYYKELN